MDYVKQKIRIVLPAYNEEENLPKLFGRIDLLANQVPYLDIDVLVVNDGSKDNTLKVAQAYEPKNYTLSAYDLQPNRGLAGALRKGFEIGTEGLKDTDVLVVLDADDSHNPALIEQMVKQVNAGSHLVIASRFQRGARIKGLTEFRKFTGWAAGFIFRICAPITGVRDYTCGYRAYKVSMLRKMNAEYGDKFIEEQGFACMAEVLLKIAAEDAIIHEVPMILRYDFKMGESKMNVMQTVKRTLQLAIFKNRQIKNGSLKPKKL